MTKQLTKKDKLLLTINWKTSFKENHTLNFIWINKFKFLQNAVPYRRDKSTDIFLYSYCFYKSIFLNSEPIQITYIKIFDSVRSRWRASRRVRKKKKKGKDVESQTRKILLLKMLQFIVARWSHPRRIAVAFREVYLHFAKQNACLPCPFSPSPLSFSTIHTRFTPSLSVPRFVVNGHREWTRRKGIHFVPFDGDETQTRPYLFLSFSFFFFPLLFRRYLSFLYFHDFESQQ